MVPYGQLWSHMVLYGPVWSYTLSSMVLYMVQYGPIWSIWFQMVLFGPIWFRLVLNGSVWSQMFFFGPLLFHMVRYGHVWSHQGCIYFKSVYFFPIRVRTGSIFFPIYFFFFLCFVLILTLSMALNWLTVQSMPKKVLKRQNKCYGR